MTAKTTKLTPVEEGKLEQFPQLKFYASQSGNIYFDAMYYLEVLNLGRTHSIPGFEKEFSLWIEPTLKVYGIDPGEVLAQDSDTGHVMIHEVLMILFLAYTDERYRVEIIERIWEMEVTGVTISDSRLVDTVKNRFSKEFVNKLMENYGKE